MSAPPSQSHISHTSSNPLPLPAPNNNNHTFARQRVQKLCYFPILWSRDRQQGANWQVVIQIYGICRHHTGLPWRPLLTGTVRSYKDTLGVGISLIYDESQARNFEYMVLSRNIKHDTQMRELSIIASQYKFNMAERILISLQFTQLNDLIDFQWPTMLPIIYNRVASYSSIQPDKITQFVSCLYSCAKYVSIRRIFIKLTLDSLQTKFSKSASLKALG